MFDGVADVLGRAADFRHEQFEFEQRPITVSPCDDAKYGGAAVGRNVDLPAAFLGIRAPPIPRTPAIGVRVQEHQSITYGFAIPRLTRGQAKLANVSAVFQRAIGWRWVIWHRWKRIIDARDRLRLWSRRSLVG